MKNINDDKSHRITLSPGAWFRRSRLSAGLNSMDGRMLGDIGITHSDIPSIVERAYPRFSIMDYVSNLIDKLVEVRQNREAALELASFDDRMLADMGIYRSDIPSISKGYYSKRHASASPLMGYGVANDDHQRAA